jgi:hypothetical protein
MEPLRDTTFTLLPGSTSFPKTFPTKRVLCVNLWQSLWPVSIVLESDSGMESLSRESAFLDHPHLESDPSCIPTISGAGPIGLVSLLACKALGATPIIITDLFQSRLDFAKTLHPGVKTVLIERGVSAEEAAGKIKEAAGGSELKYALECTGVESSIRSCIFVSIVDKERDQGRVTDWALVALSVHGFRRKGVCYRCRQSRAERECPLYLAKQKLTIDLGFKYRSHS